jgi:hypothetical protein
LEIHLPAGDEAEFWAAARAARNSQSNDGSQAAQMLNWEAQFRESAGEMRS